MQELFSKRPSYKDQVACNLIDILMEVRGISEKSFSQLDDLFAEVENFWENNPSVRETVANFETNLKRPRLCAETLFADHYNIQK
jgi:hypothetical protein